MQLSFWQKKNLVTIVTDKKYVSGIIAKAKKNKKDSNTIAKAKKNEYLDVILLNRLTNY